MTKNMNKQDIIESLNKDLEYFKKLYFRVEKQKEQASNAYSFLFDSSSDLFFKKLKKDAAFNKLKKDAAFNKTFKHVDDADATGGISNLIINIEELLDFYKNEKLPLNVSLDDLLKEHESCVKKLNKAIKHLDTCTYLLKKYCINFCNKDFKTINIKFVNKFK